MSYFTPRIIIVLMETIKGFYIGALGAFPDGQSALNLAAARLRHIAGTAWSTKRYLNIELLKDQQMRGADDVQNVSHN